MYSSQEVWDNRTMLPFALLPLFDEQRQVHKARLLVARVPRIITLGCMVDGLFYTGPPEADLMLRNLCREEKYDHIYTDVFDFKKAEWAHVPQVEQRHGEVRPCFKPPDRLHKWRRFREDTPSVELLELLSHDEEFGALLSELSTVYTKPLDRFQALWQDHECPFHSTQRRTFSCMECTGTH